MTAMYPRNDCYIRMRMYLGGLKSRSAHIDGGTSGTTELIRYNLSSTQVPLIANEAVSMRIRSDRSSKREGTAPTWNGRHDEEADLATRKMCDVHNYPLSSGKKNSHSIECTAKYQSAAGRHSKTEKDSVVELHIF